MTCPTCGGPTFAEPYTYTDGTTADLDVCTACGMYADGDCDCDPIDGFVPVPKCDDCGEDKPDGARCICEYDEAMV